MSSNGAWIKHQNWYYIFFFFFIFISVVGTMSWRSPHSRTKRRESTDKFVCHFSMFSKIRVWVKIYRLEDHSGSMCRSRNEKDIYRGSSWLKFMKDLHSISIFSWINAILVVEITVGVLNLDHIKIPLLKIVYIISHFCTTKKNKKSAWREKTNWICKKKAECWFEFSFHLRELHVWNWLCDFVHHRKKWNFILFIRQSTT